MLSHRLLEDYHLDLLFAALERLHAAPAAGPVPSREALAADHLAQLHESLAAYEVFSALPDAQRVADVVARRVEAYAADAAALRCVSLVHGHCLLSNALLESSNVLRLLSARGSLVQGQGAGPLPASASSSASASASASAAAAALPSDASAGPSLSLGGDPLVDFARVCQSLLGFDEIALGVRRAPDAYREALAAAFVARLRARSLPVGHVLTLALLGIVTSLGAEPDTARRAELFSLARGLALPSEADARSAALAALFV